MSPGPSLAMVVRHSLAGGRANGVAAAWSHASGIAIYALITLVGLATLMHSSPLLFRTISLIGAAYLAYLGFLAISSKGGIAAKLESGQAVSIRQSSREAFLVSLTSPKIMLFFIALFSQFIDVGSAMSSRSLVVATPFVVDGLWYTFITLMISSSLFLERLRRRAKLIDCVTGMVLIALALKVVVGI
jgi:threonine/homoserine/homoserine lactone efflux protein